MIVQFVALNTKIVVKAEDRGYQDGKKGMDGEGN